MQCEHQRPWGDHHRQCKRTASAGFNLCSQHGWMSKYYIGFSWQENPNDHWRHKKKAVWPILFGSREDAYKHMMEVAIFKNMPDRRKFTACVERTKPTHPVPELRRITPNLTH